MSAQAAEVLRGAAQVIETRGHCKQVLEDANGAVCMWGAIAKVTKATNALPVTDERLFELRKFFMQKFPNDGGIYPGGYDFNDAPETSGKDVQKFLLASADEIEFA